LQNFKKRVNDPRLAFAGKVGLGPFWTLVQILLYSDVAHISVISSVYSFQYTRTATVGKIYTRMQMQDSGGVRGYLSYPTLVGHIHLDKHSFTNSFY
jgi:hypothetical protein